MSFTGHSAGSLLSEVAKGGAHGVGGFLLAELSNVSTEDNERERP